MCSRRDQKNEFDNMTDLSDPIQTLKRYKAYIAVKKIQIPENPIAQLTLAMKAVQKSWEFFLHDKGMELMFPLEDTNNFTGMMGTAITINEMKFGNLNTNSGSGVAMSRNATNGNKELVIDYRIQSQGEDLMTGGAHVARQTDALDPAIQNELAMALVQLEKEYGFAVQVEFCVQDGKLFITQSKRLVAAPAVQYRILTDMDQERIISVPQALQAKALLPTKISKVNIPADVTPVGHASVTNNMVLSGYLAFSVEEITALHKQQKTAIFVTFYSRERERRELKSGDGIIDLIWDLARHEFDRLTQSGIALAGLPQAQWANEDNSAFMLADTIFSSGDEITITADGQIYEGLHEVEEVPIESVLLGGALMAGQMMPLMATTF
ncbi:MAG: pyruvate phosphate dikinase [uncultured bacterium]|nr:MAG: pyruvate phosphate dikinase [uncultured bacterium]